MGPDEKEEKAAPKPLRARHDGFTPERQRKFLKALAKSGCIADACRKARISKTTIGRHRDRFPDFDERVDSALAIASVELDMIAWKRAVEGVDETIIREGKVVAIKRKPSDSVLRLLMQGANPKKYGRTGAMPKRTIMMKLRKQAEAEARAKLRVTKEELTAALLNQLAVLKERRQRKAAAEREKGQRPDSAGEQGQ